MKNHFDVHLETPQRRFILKACESLSSNGIILYPTDTSYAFACSIENLKGISKLIELRHLKKDHQFTLVCKDLSQVSSYMIINDWAFRIIKRCTPGPYTFILKAHKDVPKKILPTRKTVGVRIPNNTICLHLLEEFGKPLISTTAQLSHEISPITEPQQLHNHVLKQFDVILDAGTLLPEASTVVNLSENEIEIIREGIGDLSLIK